MKIVYRLCRCVSESHSERRSCGDVRRNSVHHFCDIMCVAVATVAHSCGVGHCRKTVGHWIRVKHPDEGVFSLFLEHGAFGQCTRFYAATSRSRYYYLLRDHRTRCAVHDGVAVDVGLCGIPTREDVEGYNVRDLMTWAASAMSNSSFGGTRLTRSEFGSLVFTGVCRSHSALRHCATILTNVVVERHQRKGRFFTCPRLYLPFSVFYYTNGNNLEDGLVQLGGYTPPPPRPSACPVNCPAVVSAPVHEFVPTPPCSLCKRSSKTCKEMRVLYKRKQKLGPVPAWLKYCPGL